MPARNRYRQRALPGSVFRDSRKQAIDTQFPRLRHTLFEEDDPKHALMTSMHGTLRCARFTKASDIDKRIRRKMRALAMERDAVVRFATSLRLGVYEMYEMKTPAPVGIDGRWSSPGSFSGESRLFHQRVLERSKEREPGVRNSEFENDCLESFLWLSGMLKHQAPRSGRCATSVVSELTTVKSLRRRVS